MRTLALVKPPVSRLMKSGRVFLSPGENVGEHVTEGREELIIVLKGEATVYENGREMRLGCGDILYIKEGVRHNVKNTTNGELEYIYVVAMFGR